MARTMTGTVTSDKTDKTIVVTVVTHKTHPVYKKRYISSKKFMAHDEKNEAQVGDKVTIAETRPLSARKRFVLEKIVEKPAIRDGIAGDVDASVVKKKPAAAKAVKTEAVEDKEDK